jgi:rhodanese-related sulfurtransferase
MKTPAFALLIALAAALAADLPLLQPKDLAAQLSAKGEKPAIVYVGPNVLYRGRHIPGSVDAGMASRPAGLESLKAATAKFPRDREIVIYCGCCPWDRCPNIKPAYEALKQMGFTRVKALYVANNFAADWVERGYPVETGTAAGK